MEEAEAVEEAEVEADAVALVLTVAFTTSSTVAFTTSKNDEFVEELSLPIKDKKYVASLALAISAEVLAGVQV